ncbi:DUF2997 domain-containing protein [Paenibacillus sp. VTT E-133291]|uniref:DUF2997 domain-containing protein n=1 Tax=Paenibacillus sp. VTT E-133291 TaxID=1986223 RepID=UPI000BA1793B|nr:DUF2997 domain-containing protein [Paenibacillus sp. VTT E-133291]OZQ97404.1 hypothetical protein CA598_06310 [Paenibacillus sp. VTT E-133291]
MNLKKTIEFTFPVDGSIQIEAIGFQGIGCEAATKGYEEALGMMVKREKKTEYQMQLKNKTIQKNGR